MRTTGKMAELLKLWPSDTRLAFLTEFDDAWDHTQEWSFDQDTNTLTFHL